MKNRLLKLIGPAAAALLLAACGSVNDDDGGGGSGSGVIAGTVLAAPGYSIQDLTLSLCASGTDCGTTVRSVGPVTTGRTEYPFEFTGLEPGRYDLYAASLDYPSNPPSTHIGAALNIMTGDENVWLELTAIEDAPDDDEAIMSGVLYLPGATGASSAGHSGELSATAERLEGVQTATAFAAGELDLMSSNSLNSNLPVEAVPGELIVTFETGVLFSQSSLGTMSVGGIELQHVQGTAGGQHLYRIEEAADPLAVAKALRDRPGIATATPNWILHSFATPNDALYDLQWHLDVINMEAAWDVRTGSSGITVAIADTGSINHPDLNFTGGYDFISTVTDAGDGDGRDPDPTDEGEGSGYHGAHVAGTVGAQTNNTNGVAGVSWNVQLQPIRVLGKDGRGTTFDILDGVTWAAGGSVGGITANPNPAQVVNLSLGANSGFTCAEILGGSDNFFTNLHNTYGTIFVVAAGNDNANTSGVFPANCPGVITVGATGPNNTAAPYSNFGTAVDVFAPGGDLNYSFSHDGQSYPYGVLSPILSDTGQPVYAFFQGTSMAAPHVAGLVALMLAEDPGLSLNQVVSRLQSTASQSVSKSGYSAGLIDAAAALGGAGGGEPPPPPPPPPPGDVVTYVLLSACDNESCSISTPAWYVGYENLKAGGEPYRVLGLSAGRYFVEAWQDLNGNTDLNAVPPVWGIDPNEPYGFHPNVVTLYAGQTTPGINISLSASDW